jgi:hypothetical protein
MPKAASRSRARKSPSVVLRFVGDRPFRGAPARDLYAEDLARLAYRRSLSISGADGIRPDPRSPDADVVAQITAELIGSGLYSSEG